MSDIFAIEVAPGRVLRIQADNPEQAAQGARKVLENESGQKSDNLAQAFGQGATMNFGDEITAGIRSAFPKFSNWMMDQPKSAFGDGQTQDQPDNQTVSTAPTMEGRYDEELQREREKAAHFKETNPVLATGANVAGGLATTALAAPLLPAASGAGLIGNTLKMGATGAALGGVAGAGEGEGVEDRIAKALMGAGTGGALGAAAPVVGTLGRAALESTPGRYVSEKIVSPAARSIAGLLGQNAPKSLSAAAADGGPPPGSWLTNFADSTGNVAQTGAVERLATALQRGKIDSSTVQRRLGQLGDEAMIADTDPQFLSMARSANTMPGETRTYAKNVLEGRDRQAGNRLVRAFEGDEAPPSTFALRGENQAFDQNRRAVGERAYGDMNDAGLKQSPELMALYENPVVKRALDTVMAQEKNTRIGTNRAPASLVDIMHKVKQEIADQGVAATGRGASTQNYYRDLAGHFVDTFKAANPAVREADAAYRQAASLPEHFDAGRAFLGRGTSEKAMENSAPALGDLLGRADPQQAIAARAGATNAVRETALEGTGPARALARRIDESTPVRDKIVQLYGSQRSTPILKQAGAERTYAETSNDILRGSKTADKLAEAFDGGNAGFKVSSGGVSPRLYERLADLIKKATGPNESVRNEIGRITLNPNASENQRILELAQILLQRRAMGSPLRAGIAEAGGSIMGGQ